MPPRDFRFHKSSGGSALAIRVIPGGNRTLITRILRDGIVEIKLNTPNQDGKANEELIRFLCELIRVKKSDVEIIAGHSQQDKLVSIHGIDTSVVTKRIRAGLRRR
jgi:uncharacterized protein (TIGR00251 family)